MGGPIYEMYNIFIFYIYDIKIYIFIYCKDFIL